MKPSRPARFIAALLTLFCLLFAQLAVAAYACPAAPSAHSSMTIGASGTMAMMADDGAMADCPDMNLAAARSALCQAHCQPKHQTLEAPAAPHVPPFVASTLTLVLRAIE